MTRRMWLWAAMVAVPAVVAGSLTYASTQRNSGYTCPISGESLPCAKCCPLNAPAAETAAAQANEPTADDGFICPINGETLSCPNCCPLNGGKAK